VKAAQSAADGDVLLLFEGGVVAAASLSGINELVRAWASGADSGRRQAAATLPHRCVRACGVGVRHARGDGGRGLAHRIPHLYPPPSPPPPLPPTPPTPHPRASPLRSKWELEGQQCTLDLVGAPNLVPPLFAALPPAGTLSLLAVGVNPALALYPARLSEDRSGGVALGQIAAVVAAKLTGAVTGAVLSFAKSWWGGGGGDAAQPAASEAAAEAAAAAVQVVDLAAPGSRPPRALAGDRSLNDPRRRVTCVCLDPSGQLAATADGFGRVMLVSVQDCVVLRLWKGCREAQLGWVTLAERWPGREDGVRLRAHLRAAAGAGAASVSWGLYLVLYLPHRGALELWRMRAGPRAASFPVPAGGRLLTALEPLPAEDEAPPPPPGQQQKEQQLQQQPQQQLAGARAAAVAAAAHFPRRARCFLVSRAGGSAEGSDGAAPSDGAAVGAPPAAFRLQEVLGGSSQEIALLLPPLQPLGGGGGASSVTAPDRSSASTEGDAEAEAAVVNAVLRHFDSAADQADDFSLHR
jgi:hypothetical protein